MKSSYKHYTAKAETGQLKGCIELVKELYDYREVIYRLIKQQITHGTLNTRLGLVWVFLVPVATIIIMAFLFPLITRNQMENYVIYLFSGFIVFTFILNAVIVGSSCILSREGLLKKIYAPNSIFPISYVSAEMVSTLIGFAVFYIILLFKFNYPLPNLFYLTLSMLLVYMFCIGASMVVSVLVVMVRDIQKLLNLSMRAFFFLTPIFYPVTILPHKYQVLMEFNPVYQYVRLFQTVIYYGEAPALSMILPALGLAIGMLMLGVIFQYRFSSRLIYYI